VLMAMLEKSSMGSPVMSRPVKVVGVIDLISSRLKLAPFEKEVVLHV